MVYGRGLELLLALAIVSLAGQLSWPAARDWWRSPAPGAIGIGRFDSYGTLAANAAGRARTSVIACHSMARPSVECIVPVETFDELA